MRHLLTFCASVGLLAYDLRPGKKFFFFLHLVIMTVSGFCMLPCRVWSHFFFHLDFNISQERPCTRCIKRNIGHLCHDEPRESFKKPKNDHTLNSNEEEQSSPKQSRSPPPGAVPDGFEAGTDPLELKDSALAIALSAGPQPETQDPMPINQSTTANATQPELIDSLNQQR